MQVATSTISTISTNPLRNSDAAARRGCPAGALLLTAAAIALAAPLAVQAAEPAGQKKEDALEIIIVTAERLGRSVMDTSTSVVVLDAAAIEGKPALESVKDLVSRIPNITVTGKGNFAPSIRGVDGTGPAQGADAFFAGTRARLNVQIDGRPASYNEIVFGDVGVWDLGQVEVLRGPQSTLQGRNAVAGTMVVKTADPTYETEVKARALAGNLDTRQYSAAWSAPIVDDQLAFRVAVDRRTSESFLSATPFPGVDDPAEFEANTYRAKLLIEPSALQGFSALLTLNHSDFRGPQAELVQQPYDQHINRFDATFSVFEPSATAGIVDLRWDASDTLGVQALLSYTDTNVKRWARPGGGNAEIDGREIVAQPSIHFQTGSGRVKGIAGAYFFDAQQDEFIDLFGGGTFDDSTRTAAVFTEATIVVSERFDFTLGARYEEERRRREGSVFLFAIDLDETYTTFLPKLVLSWHPTEDVTLGVLATRGYNGGGAGFTFQPPFLAYTFDPEYVSNYEGFVRATVADGAVLIMGNVFYSDYEDMQLPFPLSSVSTVIRNAQDVQTYGAEVSATWKVLPTLELYTGLGTVQSDIKGFPGSGFEGNELPRAPTLTGSVGLRYAHPQGFEASLDARYSGGYFSTITNDPVAETDPFWIANAQLAYAFPHAKVFGYVKNLADAGDPLYISRADAYGPGYAEIIRPRTYGVGVEVGFK